MAISVKALLAIIIIINFVALISFFSVGNPSTFNIPASKMPKQKESVKKQKPHIVTPNDHNTSKELPKQPVQSKSDVDHGDDHLDNFIKTPNQNSSADSTDDDNFLSDSAPAVQTQIDSPQSKDTDFAINVNFVFQQQQQQSSAATSTSSNQKQAPANFMSDQDNLDLINFNENLHELNESVKIHQIYAKAVNPFRKLGFYKEIPSSYLDAYPRGKPWYDTVNLGLKKNPSYCDYADLYNIFNPPNVYHQMNFVADYTSQSIVRSLVIEKIGVNVMPNISMNMIGFKDANYDLNVSATMFFTKRVDFHYFHEIGKQFLCANQMYNHIPGHGILIRKELHVGAVNAYANFFQSKPQCFNREKYFPPAYRLYNGTECNQFFVEINDDLYHNKKQNASLQYILQLGYGAHWGSGIFLLNDKEEAMVREQYENGKLCGKNDRILLAQKFISKPLLLDKQNKFDFSMYLLISSVDPIIAYYHDGFLKVSSTPYDPNSTDSNSSIFSQQKDSDAKSTGNDTENKDDMNWTLQQLQDYLIKIGKVNDNNWLDSYLRPEFKKACIQLIQMSKHALWQHSSVYEIFELDFILDNDLNIWFIEANGSPQFTATNPTKEKFIVETLTDMFEIQYAYLRSKTKRLLGIVHRVMGVLFQQKKFQIAATKLEFSEANKNFLESEWEVRKNNTWSKIIDENLQGTAAYMNLIDNECI